MSIIGEQAAKAFPAAFAAFGHTLRLPAQDAVPLPDLLRPAALAQVIGRFAALFPGGDRRAVLSMWSQHYLLALVPPSVVSALVSPQDPPLALDTASAVLSAEGQLVALCLPDLGRPATSSCPATRLTPLLRGHLEPLASELAASGLPPRVFWGNTAATMAWTLDIALVPAGRVLTVIQAMQTKRWVDAGANPLFSDACATARGGCRLACCLRYRLPGVASCPDCPRKRAQALIAAARTPDATSAMGCAAAKRHSRTSLTKSCPTPSQG